MSSAFLFWGKTLLKFQKSSVVFMHLVFVIFALSLLVFHLWSKKMEKHVKTPKKIFQPANGVRSTRLLVKIHNNKQTDREGVTNRETNREGEWIKLTEREVERDRETEREPHEIKKICLSKKQLGFVTFESTILFMEEFYFKFYGWFDLRQECLSTGRIWTAQL